MTLHTFYQRARARLTALAPGVLFAAIIAMASTFVTDHYGGPVMLYVLLFGIAFNFLSENSECAAGVQFSSKRVLQLGVALLGARITIAEITALGAPSVALVLSGVVFAIASGWALGRVCKLSSDHAVLSAGAVAICGASAALAISSVLPQHKDAERNTILTVVGVTTLSTVAMVIYPIIARTVGLNDSEAGVFIGATIHDVAQVVGAGYMISDVSGETSAVVKLMRVACLAPVVMTLAFVFRRQRQGANPSAKTPILPGFLIAFVALVLINSAGFLPKSAAMAMGEASRWCLLTAVAALGMKTSLKDVFAVGPRPITVLILQSALLAVFILVGLSWLTASAS